MVFNKVEPDYYDERKHVLEQLRRFNDPFEFSKDVSFAAYEAAVGNIHTMDAAYNAAIDAAEAAKNDRLAAIETEKQLLLSLRACFVGTKGKNSDEYVATGAKRQSEIDALTQQSREEKKKAADDATKKAADDAAQKVIDAAVQKALDEAAQKAAAARKTD
jgi:hypothetical protein